MDSDRSGPCRRTAVLGLVAGCLLLNVHASHAAPALFLTITPSAITFPDASPTTTPSIPATAAVAVQVTAVGGLPTDAWSVQALASGDLAAGPNSIAISNVTWTSAQTAGNCLNWCTCQAGTASRVAPQGMIAGQGSTGVFGVTCTQNYRLANNWSYRPGAYTQVITITATSP